MVVEGKDGFFVRCCFLSGGYDSIFSLYWQGMTVAIVFQVRKSYRVVVGPVLWVICGKALILRTLGREGY